RVGKGTAPSATAEGWGKYYFESARCASCGYTGPELTPGLFSFHHPAGMCPLCRGLGHAGAGEEQGARHGSSAVAADTEEPPEIPGLSSEPPPCPACNGTRLCEAALSVRLGNLSIDRVSAMNPATVAQWLDALDF